MNKTCENDGRTLYVNYLSLFLFCFFFFSSSGCEQINVGLRNIYELYAGEVLCLVEIRERCLIKRRKFIMLLQLQQSALKSRRDHSGPRARDTISSRGFHFSGDKKILGTSFTLELWIQARGHASFGIYIYFSFFG